MEKQQRVGGVVIHPSFCLNLGWFAALRQFNAGKERVPAGVSFKSGRRQHSLDSGLHDLHALPEGDCVPQRHASRTFVAQR